MADMIWSVYRESQTNDFYKADYGRYNVTRIKREYTYYKYGLKNNNGFTMIKDLWSTISQGESFLCTSNDGEFRFFVKCAEAETEKYIVDFNLFHEKWPGDVETNKALCLAHMEEIKEGLFRFPFVTYFDYICSEEIQ